MTHKDKEILCDSLPFYSETVTPHVRLQTGVSPVRGFLFMLWCQGTGQRRRKHRWQNSADPAKPQNCSSCPLAWLTLQTVWLSRQLQTRLWDVNCYQSSSCFGSFWADHGRTVGFRVSTQCAVGTVCWKDGAQRGERFSVFLENVRQEMPKAHLELLHIQEVYAWQPRPSARRLPT